MFSRPLIKQEYKQEITKNFQFLSPSNEEPQDILDRMVVHLEKHAGFKNSNGMFRIPVAVIVTKTDAFGLESKITQTSLNYKGNNINRKIQDIESEKVRTWLSQCGQGNIVRSVESVFENVKYFYCSP
jgi:hypothetical protein